MIVAAIFLAFVIGVPLSVAGLAWWIDPNRPKRKSLSQMEADLDASFDRLTFAVATRTRGRGGRKPALAIVAEVQRTALPNGEKQ